MVRDVCAVVVTRGSEVGVVEVAAALQHLVGGVLVGLRRRAEAVEVVEVLPGAVVAQVFDESGSDVGVVRDDDDWCGRVHGELIRA